jgi:hypothetical protein
LTVLKTSNIVPGRFSKDLDAATRNLLSNRREGFNSPPLSKALDQLKSFGAKRIRTFHINEILKGHL